jgi:L-amino acid N-acyltransferase YncA
MMPNRLSRRLLSVLFVRRQNDEIIDFMDLCAGTRARPYAVLKALQALAGAGLVDPHRLRLTLSGLAVASALVRPTARAEAQAREQQAPRLARCAA